MLGRPSVVNWGIRIELRGIHQDNVPTLLTRMLSEGRNESYRTS